MDYGFSIGWENNNISPFSNLFSVPATPSILRNEWGHYLFLPEWQILKNIPKNEIAVFKLC